MTDIPLDLPALTLLERQTLRVAQTLLINDAIAALGVSRKTYGQRLISIMHKYRDHVRLQSMPVTGGGAPSGGGYLTRGFGRGYHSPSRG